MSYYYPSETFDEKFVIETKNKWLKNPVLDALNEATEIVLESSKSSFPQLNFSSTCFEELNKSRQIEKNQGFPLRYLKVDNILGGRLSTDSFAIHRNRKRLYVRHLMFVVRSARILGSF
jgi:hypothetical protein